MATAVTEAALELQGLGMRFGRTQVLQDLDLVVPAGECLGIIGPNGAGKSTLFHLVSGQLAPSAGRIALHGRRIDGLPPHRIQRLGLGRSFQISRLFARLGVLDHLRCAALAGRDRGLRLWRSLPHLPDVEARAHELLHALQLETVADVPAGELDHARQRMLELGLAVAADARVLLLDEPTAGMGQRDARRVVALVRRLCAGRTVLVVEHDMAVVFGLADRVAVLEQGRLIACGKPDDVRSDPRVRAAYLGPGTDRAGAAPC